MNQLLLTLAIILAFRVNYTTAQGSGRTITILVDSAAEARRTVMDMFPRATVTNVSRIRLSTR